MDGEGVPQIVEPRGALPGRPSNPQGVHDHAERAQQCALRQGRTPERDEERVVRLDWLEVRAADVEELPQALSHLRSEGDVPALVELGLVNEQRVPIEIQIADPEA